MKVVDRKTIPIYEETCPECKSKIRYKKCEVFYSHIQFPVCGISMWANTIRPVEYVDATDWNVS